MSEAVAFTATDGDAYHQHMGRWTRRLAEPFLDFVGVVDNQQSVDLGCGTGSLAFALADRVEYQGITGIDISQYYVDYCNDLARNDARLEFRVGSATDIPLHDNSVDRMMSMLLMSFVPDTQKALAEMRRVTRPGGVIAATIWDTLGGHMTNRLMWDIIGTTDPRGNEARAVNYTRMLLRRGEMEAAWREAGLENVQYAEPQIRFEFESFDDFWLPNLGKQGPIADYVESLDEDGRENLRYHMREAYLGGDTDGPRSFAGIAFAVKGTVPQE